MMRLEVHAPLLTPSPAPTPAVDSRDGGMVPVVFMALLLPCVGVCFLFLIYLFILWCSTRRRLARLEQVKSVTGKGLSVSELEKLPKITGEELAVVVRTTECAVCLEEIESDQPARLVPGCNHGFHQLCADTWLSDHTVCPVCRAELALNLHECSGDHSPC